MLVPFNVPEGRGKKKKCHNRIVCEVFPTSKTKKKVCCHFVKLHCKKACFS